MDIERVLLTCPQQAIEVEGEVCVRRERGLAVVSALYDCYRLVTGEAAREASHDRPSQRGKISDWTQQDGKKNRV